ncbi:hypothetical protein ACIP2X_18725 [Streptomyces sp. NPDC089424]|uniref:hypothetical protein n=1 Tax=Streptomyces sp. NPDC089424 TaxID=3365917 RepID=UPI003823E63B
MSNPLPRQVIVAAGLCALLVLLFSCAAANRGNGEDGDCRSLGLVAVQATRTARPAAPPAPRLSKAPARTARPSSTPARTASARPHGHGGLDVDLTVCP